MKDLGNLIIGHPCDFRGFRRFIVAGSEEKVGIQYVGSPTPSTRSARGYEQTASHNISNAEFFAELGVRAV